MRNNETGEFELVVGNKQLLSGFFIVVLLFAVAFAMGYVVGQNTQRPARLASEGGAASSAGGAVANTAGDSRPQPASPVTPLPVASTPPPANAATGQQPPMDAAPQPTTQPATQPTTQATTQSARGPQAPAVVKPAAAPVSTGVVGPAELAPGSFWQVIAVKPEMAEAIRQTLKDKGFQVALTPGTSNLMRVLVGPYSDTTALGRARTALEGAGFHPARYKRD